MQEPARLPIPERLEPPKSTRSLMSSVRIYFYTLYNATNAKFRDLLVSVGNKDAITGNRLFDRHDAVGMIKDAAKKAEDSIVSNAKDGDIYRCIVNLMSKNGMGLRVRRQQYRQLTHENPAE